MMRFVACGWLAGGGLWEGADVSSLSVFGGEDGDDLGFGLGLNSERQASIFRIA